MMPSYLLSGCLVIFCAIVVMCASCGSAEGAGGNGAAEAGGAAGAALTRRLSDYANADGTKPDGRAGGDDSTALQKALSAGPGTVSLDAGVYNVGDVTVPAGVTLQGAGGRTLLRKTGAKQIFKQQGVANWSIRGVALDGGQTGDWRNRKDEGDNGITIEMCRDYEIVDVKLTNFNGAGLAMTWNDPEGGAHSGLGSLRGITADFNHTGILFGIRAEYLNATDLSCSKNLQGAVIHAGNVKITNSNFVGNRDGIIVSDRENGSHGIISNTMSNHNERYALLCRNVAYGMVIDGCSFFYGTIELENSTGVNITAGLISCHVRSLGQGASISRIAGNYVIPENWKWELSANTISTDNFTNKGPWQGR